MLISILGLCLIIAVTWMRTFSDVHKFQQYGYYTNQYLDAVKKTKGKLVKPYDVLYFLGVLLIFLSDSVWLRFLGLVFLGVHLYFYRLIVRAYPAKKKCVYTPRVKRMLTTSAALLLILSTLAYIAPTWIMAFFGLIVYPLSFFVLYLANLFNKPIENAINQYYYQDALKILGKNPNLIVIGVTGSYGKTSTKNVLYTMLSKDFNVLMTPESFNTKMGLTRTIREHLKPTHQILIAEMGAKEVGDIKELCEFVHPTYGVITSIGPAHLDTFKSFENIISTKGELFKYLKPGGTAFVNLDDENIRNIVLREDVHAIKYSVSGALELSPDYYIEATTIGSNGSSFTLVQNKTGKKIRLSTKLLGKHNLANVLAGLSIAISLGVSFDRLGAMTADLKPVTHRLSTRRVNDQYTVLDDAFNSNPIGSKMALEVLKNFEGNKKIIMTPGMIELGDQAYTLNKLFGEAIADACDYVILVGKKQTEPIQDGLNVKSYPSNKVYIASNLNDGFRKINEIVALGDVVLIENDLPDTFNE